MFKSLIIATGAIALLASPAEARHRHNRYYTYGYYWPSAYAYPGDGYGYPVYGYGYWPHHRSHWRHHRYWGYSPYYYGRHHRWRHDDWDD
jgi:hypothetical protein